MKTVSTGWKASAHSLAGCEPEQALTQIDKVMLQTHLGSVHLSQCAQAQWGEEERLHPHGQLPRPGAKEAGRAVGAGEAEFPGAAAHDGNAGPDQRRRQRRAGHPGTQQGRHHGQRVHAGDRGRCQADARCDILGADGEAGGGGSFVKFRTISHGACFLGMRANDRIDSIGA